MIVELLSVPVDPELCHESGIDYGQIQGGDSCGKLMAGHVYYQLYPDVCVMMQIWEECHKTKDCVGAVVPSDKYIQMYTKASHCPLV